MIALKSSADHTAGNVINACSFGLKNGYHDVIHALQVELYGRTIVQSQNYFDFRTSFKLMTPFGHDDLVKYGASIGFHPDNADSCAPVTAAAGLGGDVFCNNNTLFNTSVTQPRNNPGFYWRQKKTTTASNNSQGVNNSQCGCYIICIYIISTLC